MVEKFKAAQNQSEKKNKQNQEILFTNTVKSLNCSCCI